MNQTSLSEGNQPVTEQIDKFDRPAVEKLRRCSCGNIPWQEEMEDFVVEPPWNPEKTPLLKSQERDPLQAVFSHFALKGVSITILGLLSFILALFSPRLVAERFIFPLFQYCFTLVWPAYWSYRSESGKDEAACRRLIAYWITYVFITSMEAIIDRTLFFLPFFYEIKILLWLWILSPYTTGYYKIYTSFLCPFIVQKEEIMKEQIKPGNGFFYKTLGYISFYAKNFSQQISPIVCDFSRNEFGLSSSIHPSAESTPLSGEANRTYIKKVWLNEDIARFLTEDRVNDDCKDFSDNQ